MFERGYLSTISFTSLTIALQFVEHVQMCKFSLHDRTQQLELSFMYGQGEVLLIEIAPKVSMKKKFEIFRKMPALCHHDP